MTDILSASLGDDRLLTLDQVAEAIGLSIPTLRRMRHEKRFPPAIVIGKRRLAWRVGDIRALIADKAKQAA